MPGVSVSVLGASLPVLEPELEPEMDLSGELEELGDTESEGVLDVEDPPLQQARATIRRCISRERYGEGSQPPHDRAQSGSRRVITRLTQS